MWEAVQLRPSHGGDAVIMSRTGQGEAERGRERHGEKVENREKEEEEEETEERPTEDACCF